MTDKTDIPDSFSPDHDMPSHEELLFSTLSAADQPRPTTSNDYPTSDSLQPQLQQPKRELITPPLQHQQDINTSPQQKATPPLNPFVTAHRAAPTFLPHPASRLLPHSLNTTAVLHSQFPFLPINHHAMQSATFGLAQGLGGAGTSDNGFGLPASSHSGLASGGGRQRINSDSVMSNSSMIDSRHSKSPKVL